jgi:hypothetical protein
MSPKTKPETSAPHSADADLNSIPIGQRTVLPVWARERDYLPQFDLFTEPGDYAEVRERHAAALATFEAATDAGDPEAIAAAATDLAIVADEAVARTPVWLDALEETRVALWPTLVPQAQPRGGDEQPSGLGERVDNTQADEREAMIRNEQVALRPKRAAFERDVEQIRLLERRRNIAADRPGEVARFRAEFAG